MGERGCDSVGELVEFEVSGISVKRSQLSHPNSPPDKTTPAAIIPLDEEIPLGGGETFWVEEFLKNVNVPFRYIRVGSPLSSLFSPKFLSAK